LRYESSPGLKTAILNNLLVNLRGHAGAFHEMDLLQEHFNHWLEDMIQKYGGDFNDSFYRVLIAPNVFHFLSLKDNFQVAFDLATRSKTHTSPDIHDEVCRLIESYKEAQLHYFRPGRSFGHAASNVLDKGYGNLDTGKLATYLSDANTDIDILRHVLQHKKGEVNMNTSQTTCLPSDTLTESDQSGYLGSDSDGSSRSSETDEPERGGSEHTNEDGMAGEEEEDDPVREEDEDDSNSTYSEWLTD
jgi:hypothetical protein